VLAVRCWETARSETLCCLREEVSERAAQLQHWVEDQSRPEGAGEATARVKAFGDAKRFRQPRRDGSCRSKPLAEKATWLRLHVEVKVEAVSSVAIQLMKGGHENEVAWGQGRPHGSFGPQDMKVSKEILYRGCSPAHGRGGG